VELKLLEHQDVVRTRSNSDLLKWKTRNDYLIIKNSGENTIGNAQQGRKNAWTIVRTNILRGMTIGENGVSAAGRMVRKDFSKKSKLGDIIAKFIKASSKYLWIKKKSIYLNACNKPKKPCKSTITVLYPPI